MQNITGDFASDFEALVNGIAEGGNAFNSFSAAGRTNLSNLQSSIASTISYAEAMGVDATEAVAGLFRSLQAQGIDTANLLAMVSKMNIPGINSKTLKSLVSGTKEMSPVGKEFSNVVSSMSSSLGGLKDSAGAAEKQVRTLIDYASDLASVFERAFDIRFSGGQTLDKISKSFSSIAKATADAREEIQSLNADIQSLEADQALQQYFLSVAEAYGDTLKAQEIRANLAQIDVDLASKTKTLQKAQDKTNKTLIGNTDAAIDNRSEILGLVKDYQDHIKALASSGASQETLRVKSAQLKAEFVAQATQLGYNETELQQYASAFDDVTVAINNVPRDVTVDANIDPALQALA